MNRQKSHWIKEAYKELELALIGCRKKTREHIEKAIEALEKYELEPENKLLHKLLEMGRKLEEKVKEKK